MLGIMGERWKVVTESGATAQFANSSGQVFGLPPDQLAALNANAKIWMPLKGSGAFYPHSWAIEDGSYLRINNVTLGYTLPKRLTGRAKISSFRIFATVNNLAVISSYSGFDPDVTARRSDPLTPGVDFAAYPRAKTWVFGVNVNF